MSRRSLLPQIPRPTRAQGFTLVELMVALALGLFMMTVVIQGFASVSAATNTNSAVAESHTNGRHALEMLKREVRHAALHRLVWDKDQIGATALAATDYGCGAGFNTNLSDGVTGFNDTNPFTASCLAAAADRSYAQGDILVLRRTELEPAASFDAGAPYVSTSYGMASLFLGTTVTVPPLMPEPNFNYRVVSDVYYINSFTNSATEQPLVPALYRLRLSAGANPTMTPELIASNVEHLQVEYAVPDTTGNIRYFNANAVTDWTSVRTARISLLIRESRPDPGLASGNYTLADVAYAPADNFRRAVYSSTVAVRNNR